MASAASPPLTDDPDDLFGHLELHLGDLELEGPALLAHLELRLHLELLAPLERLRVVIESSHQQVDGRRRGAPARLLALLPHRRRRRYSPEVDLVGPLARRPGRRDGRVLLVVVLIAATFFSSVATVSAAASASMAGWLVVIVVVVVGVQVGGRRAVPGGGGGVRVVAVDGGGDPLGIGVPGGERGGGELESPAQDGVHAVEEAPARLEGGIQGVGDLAPVLAAEVTHVELDDLDVLELVDEAVHHRRRP
ncbi:hypothetical protein SELMODRAFT_442293 [Selaginella moellendorffii]|uniref:Uncharacterized protein n=1 Tax=Selaginella moellendorffii TaxID=88036 RepID=D8RSB1_SELML|nr:hypothetical protein SELMODRAFT_442293 [Selaginella moellendorffii]